MSSTPKRIKKLEAEIAEIGVMLPGGIREQWNVCGKAGCKCKDPDYPKRHGPYYQLSFSLGGKSSSMFIKQHDLLAAREAVGNYARFKKLTEKLLLERVAWARKGGLSSEGDS